MSDDIYTYSDAEEYEVINEHALYTNAYVDELPDNEDVNSLILSTLNMTDYEMIDFVTDLYVKTNLSPINYDAVEMEDMPCEKDVVFERLYDFS